MWSSLKASLNLIIPNRVISLGYYYRCIYLDPTAMPLDGSNLLYFSGMS